MPVPEGKTYAPAFDVDMNQPGIQDWLQEMKDKSLSQYDIMTVGEANGVNPDNAEEWVGEHKGKFNMIFQFEHLGLWSTGDTQFDVKSYKDVLNRWQKRLEGMGWNALFIENHDQPRRVSTWEMTNNFGMNLQRVMLSHIFTTRNTVYLSRPRNWYDKLSIRKYRNVQ